MNVKEIIASLFNNRHPMEEEKADLPQISKSKNPLFTFYRLGPEYMTWAYPIDPVPIERDILAEDGIIGPAYYNEVPDAIEHLKDYDNEWFKEEERQSVCEHLRHDLLLLAEKHNQSGAYTLLGSLSDNRDEQIRLFRKAAELGNAAGMVSYGMFLCVDNRVDEGAPWVEKGAEQGNEIGMLIMAISFQFGTLTTINQQKAAYYYRRLINEHHNFFAYINYGVMYVDANYLHTAKRLFDEAQRQQKEVYDHLKDYGVLQLLDNNTSCAQLLLLPVEERRKRVVLQYHSPEIDNIFCADNQSPMTVLNPDTHEEPVPWQPDEPAEIDPLDMYEHESALQMLVPGRAIVKYPYDDFLFPTISVEIRNEKIFGNQHELVFLEKNVHLELNQYIQQHFGQLRAAFRQCGYYFLYMPAHAQRLSERMDVIGYMQDEFNSYSAPPFFHAKEKTESAYWDYLFTSEHLPADCAGFLRYTPKLENLSERRHYDFILFPYRPGTNWDKAFSCLVDYVASLPFVEIKKKKTLPRGTSLFIDEQYRIFIMDNAGINLAEIKMPVLSKALYFVFLSHTEGFPLKYLVDYRDELVSWYRILSNRKDIDKSINDLVDPTKNSANEKISRIRHAFEEALKVYDESSDRFAPVGKKGETYAVTFDRSRILWEPKDTNLFKKL